MKIINADGLVLGRLASVLAKQLLSGDEIVVINAEKAIITGPKKTIFLKYQKMRDISHARKGPHFPRMPDRILKRTVRGMIPYQTPRGRKAFKNLKVYIGTPSEFENKKSESVSQATLKAVSQYVELGEVSRYLRAKI
ncbi:50S ribosomal protein L13 [[Eubacterium] cellulosolvens]